PRVTPSTYSTLFRSPDLKSTQQRLDHGADTIIRDADHVVSSAYRLAKIFFELIESLGDTHSVFVEPVPSHPHLLGVTHRREILVIHLRERVDFPVGERDGLTHPFVPVHDCLEVWHEIFDKLIKRHEGPLISVLHDVARADPRAVEDSGVITTRELQISLFADALRGHETPVDVKTRDLLGLRDTGDVIPVLGRRGRPTAHEGDLGLLLHDPP